MATLNTLQVDRIVYLVKDVARREAWVLANKALDTDKAKKLVEKIEFDNQILLALGKPAVAIEQPKAQIGAGQPNLLVNLL